MTYVWDPISINVDMKNKIFGQQTGSYPATAEKHSVLQPGLVPDMDVVETHMGLTIQMEIEKAKRGPASRSPEVIKQRDYLRNDLYIGRQLRH